MTIPQRLLNAVAGAGGSTQDQRDHYREVKVSLADAIDALDRGTGNPVDVNQVAFRGIEGQLYYRVSTRQGVYLVSGRDASVLTITEDVARRIAASKGADPKDIESATLLRAHDQDYLWGPLPAWRIEVADDRRTAYYVEVAGGEVRTTHRWGRVLAFLTGMHTLEFLNPYMSGGRIRLIMWVFSIVGTIMTLFGFWILWIQFQNWRSGRSRKRNRTS